MIRDRWGQLLDDPIAAPVLEIDRTPPRMTDRDLATRWAEGEPLGAIVSLSEPAAIVKVTWVSDRGTRAIPFEVSAARSGGAVIRIGALSAGSGRLVAEAVDRAGNRVRWEKDVEVAGALLGPIVIYPAGRKVPPGDEIFVEVPLAPDGVARRRAELRLFDELGERRAQQSLADHARVSFRAPEEAGRYRLEVGPTGQPPFTGGTIEFEVDPQANPVHRLRELVLRVRKWETRKAREGEGPSVEAERLVLVEDLHRELLDDPRRGQARRALARMHLLSATPRRDLAAEVLHEGLRLALPDSDRAALLNDLAVITLESDPDQAHQLLTRAVKLDPTSMRHQNLADICWRIGRFSDASRGYSAAFALNPESTVSRERWALAMARRGTTSREEARTTLEGWFREGKVDRQTAERLYQVVCGVEGASR